MPKSDATTKIDAVTALIELARDFQNKGDTNGALETYNKAISLLDKNSRLRKELKTIVDTLVAGKTISSNEAREKSVGNLWKKGILSLLILIIGVIIGLGTKYINSSPESNNTLTAKIQIFEETSVINTQTPTARQNNSTQENTKTPKNAIFLTIKAYRVSLRAGPHPNHPESPERYEKGVKMEVLGKYYDWFYVKSPDGKTGWLFVGWVQIDPSQLNSIPDIEQIPTPPFERPTPRPKPTKEHAPYP